MLKWSRIKPKGTLITMSFKIVSDSSADLLKVDKVDFESVPLKIITDEHEYVDDGELDVAAMLSDLSKYNGKSKSSCPNSEEFLRAFGDADNVFCITITSGLSGSFNAASVAARTYMEEHPERRVHLIDSLSTGAENALLIEKIASLISEGCDYDTVVDKITEYHSHTRLIFALESMHNLSRNGRVSPIVAKLCGVLGIRIVGRASEVGTLEIIEKSRGERAMLADIVKNMKGDGWKGGKVRIHHASNPETASLLREKILAEHPTASVEVAPARGLCSFYAESRGLLVGFEV